MNNKHIEIITKLKKLIKKIEDLEPEFGLTEITLSQAQIILPIVSDERGYSIQELSNKAQVDKAFVSRTIADLESKGIVEREKTSDNVYKNHKIVLSEKGKAFYAVQAKRVLEFSGKWLNGVTRDEFNQFMNILDRLTEQKE